MKKRALLLVSLAALSASEVDAFLSPNYGLHHGVGSPKEALTYTKLVDAIRRPVYGTQRQKRGLHMSLQPLPARTMRVLLPTIPTFEQWLSHWGRTPIQRQGRIMETLGVGFMWMWCGFFLSRTVVGAVARKIFALVMVIRWIADPLRSAYLRNISVRGGGNGSVCGALFSGRVACCRELLAPEAEAHHVHFEMVVRDKKGRELLFEVPMIPAYRSVREGMHCEVVILSRDADFSDLTGVSEAYIPETGIWVGQHPLLRRGPFLLLLARREKKRQQQKKRTAPMQFAPPRAPDAGGTRVLHLP